MKKGKVKAKAIKKISKSKPQRIKAKKVISKSKKTNKNFILFMIIIAAIVGLLLLTLIFIVSNPASKSEVSSTGGLPSLKAGSLENWCNGADVNKNGVVDISDLYLARQNNLGTDLKTLYLASVNLGRIDCTG